MVCEFIPSHDYHKAKMFKPGVLENFREMHAARLTADSIKTEHFVAIDEDELNLPVQTQKNKSDDRSKPDYRTKKVDFFLQKFIALDDRQATAVKSEYEDDCKPTVVTGAAGSGKTCIAVTLLAEKAEREFHRSQREGTAFLPVLYVAESEELCKLVERNWKLSPLSDKFTHGEVQIKTYQQVIRDAEQAAQNPVPVNIASAAHFRAFITESIANVNKNKALKQSLGSDFLANIDKMYKELRIISGYKTAEEYCKLAGTQSLLSNRPAKEWLFKEATQYKKYLAKLELIDYALYQPKAENCYAFVIPDEAQDFSWGQLNALLRLAVKQKGYPQICFLEDEQQGLVDLLPKLIYLKTQLEAKLGNMNFVELNVAYRCPRAVVTVANAFLSIGSKLADRTAKYMDAAPEMENTGIVELFTEFSDHLKASLCTSPPPPGFAVVTTDALKPAAIKIFGDVVFTTKEIKGLEFKHIVWYGLMSDEIFYRASRYWLAAKNKQFFAEAGERLEFAPAFHALYTACTRATEKLTIIEDSPESLHKLKDLLTELKAVINKIAPTKHSSPTFKSAAQVAMDVMEQIRTFILASQSDKAHSFGAAHGVSAAEIDDMIADLTTAQDIATEENATAKIDTNSARLSTSSATLHGSKNNNGKTTAVSAPRKSKRATAVRDYSKDDLEQPYNAPVVDTDHYKALFNHPKVNLYLFQTPLFDEGECLFTLMFDKIETRKIIITELHLRFNSFLPFFTQSALCRKSRYTKENKLKLIPAFCMVQSNEIMNFMSKSDSKVLKIWDLIDADILAIPMDMPNSFIHGTFMLYWIAFNDRSLSVLNHLRKLNKLCKLTPQQFAQNFYVTEDRAMSFFGCIIHRAEPGYKLAAEIIGDNKALGSKISVLQLHTYDYRGDDAPAAIELLNHSIYGRTLLIALETINPRLAAFTCLRLSTEQARQLHKQIRPAIEDSEQRFREIDAIVQGYQPDLERSKQISDKQSKDSIIYKLTAIMFLKDRLERLLTEQPNTAYIYLFQLALADKNPLLDQQCWLYHLMHDDDTRPLMYLLLSHKKFGPPLLQNMPVNALCGNKMKDLVSIPPFMWLSSSRERIALLKSIIYPDSLDSRLIPLGILSKKIDFERYRSSELGKFYSSPEFPVTPLPNMPVSFVTLLLLTEEGRSIINTLCSNNPDTALIFSPQFLLICTLCDTTENRTIPLLALLIRQEELEEILVMILMQYSQAQVKLMTELIFYSFFSEYQDDISVYTILESMLAHKRTIEFMTKHLRAFPDIARKFNPVYFVSDDFFKDMPVHEAANTPQSKLVKIMKSTPAGTTLFTTIQNIILGTLNKQAEIVAGKSLLMK